MDDNKEKILDISWKTILKIAVAVLSFYFVYLIRDILVWFLFALIISILFNPAIDFFQKRRVPRILSVIFIYCSIFTAMTFFIYFTVPNFISEIQHFSQFFPEYFEKISPTFKTLGIQAFENIDVFTSALTDLSGNVFNAMFAIFGGIFSTLFVMMVAIFLSLEEKMMERGLTLFFPKKYETYVLSLWSECQKKVSKWFLSRIAACLFVGVLSCVSFLILDVQYPFSLALLSGVLNFIPFMGPLITAFLLLLIVGIDSISKALFVLVAFSVIQLIENSILTPALLKKCLGIPPALLLLTLAIGGALWGPLGAILCVPLGGILFEFVRDFLRKKREEDAMIL